MTSVRILLAVFVSGIYLPALSQRIGHRITLPSSIASVDLEWVDFDNDGLLDIMLLSRDQFDNRFLNIIKGTANGMGMTIDKSIPIMKCEAYVLADYNRDNKMDLMVSGNTTTVLYINRGDLDFEEKVLTLLPFSVARFADLDNNGLPELITSGETTAGFYLRILKQQSEFDWKIVHDSIAVKCSSIEPLDAEGDGDIDLFVSGQVTDDSVMSGFLVNEGQYIFKPQGITSLQGNTGIGDLDNDGFFEVVLMGHDQNDKPFGKKYRWAGSRYEIADLPVKLKNPKLFIADLDFDGTADVAYQGLNSSNQNDYEIWFGDRVPDLVYLNYDSKLGDFDHDGRLDAMDLDLAADPKVLYVVRNSDTRENLGPREPKNAVALPIFNRLFMYWQRSTDDHTPQASLTYDVFLQGVPNYQAGEFDLSNEKRLTVTHGNNGTNNFKLLKNIPLESLKYSIQAVDNSFHTGGLCIGNGTGCGDTKSEEIVVCSQDETKLTTPADVLWFSFARGFLGKKSELDFSTEENDTIFYYNSDVAGCSSLRTWTIKVNEPALKVSASHYKIVKGGEVQLRAEGADRYVWTPEIGLDHPDIGNPIASPLSSIQYTVTGFNTAGCSSSATVNVIVEDTSFIPTLFSPNEDGQNDHLKIYGLSGAQNFSFSIYDRDGALVFKTSDVSEAVQRGWDGTKNGTKQPTGVYFWKVSGESSAGKVLLNGKNSGYVVLIR